MMTLKKTWHPGGGAEKTPAVMWVTKGATERKLQPVRLLNLDKDKLQPVWNFEPGDVLEVQSHCTSYQKGSLWPVLGCFWVREDYSCNLYAIVPGEKPAALRYSVREPESLVEPERLFADLPELIDWICLQDHSGDFGFRAAETKIIPIAPECKIIPFRLPEAEPKGQLKFDFAA